MITGKYTLRDYFNDPGLNTIIIPEIQRDYVWQGKQVEHLIASINTDYEKYKSFKFEDGRDDELASRFAQYVKRIRCSSNIGFLYAYSNSGINGEYYLIDGQQRITTVFLLIFVLSVFGSEEDIAVFKRVFCHKLTLTPKLDYRVREASHTFIVDLVSSALRSKKISSGWIKNQSWYLKEYDHDVSICSAISNIDIIIAECWKINWIGMNGAADSNVIKYILDYLEFWYFDTKLSSQGEDLYIYMNARGESMQDHENIKADLLGRLPSLEEKQRYGKLWEQWQDYFWLKKGSNSNSDKGFNEFLNCIAGLNNYSAANKKYSKHDFDGTEKGGANRILYQDLISNLSLQHINDYINGLSVLESEIIQKTLDMYSYNVWFEKARNLFWEIINRKTTNWFADATDEDRSAERRNMTYCWSLLEYLKKYSVQPQNNNIDLLRTVRLFYLRYQNNNRAVVASLKSIDIIIEKGPWDNDVLVTEEERIKYGFLLLNSDSEEILWKIEDHPLNLDGSGVGNINCSHLIDFNSNPSSQKIQDVYDSFLKIFPLSVNNKGYVVVREKTLLNSLLFYCLINGKEPFWDVAGPWYYTKLDFSDWRRIIRGKARNHKTGTETPNTIFINYFRDKENVIIHEKVKQEIETIDKNAVSDDNILFALCWYASNLGNDMWNEGNYITYNYDRDKPDPYFPQLKLIKNFKGNYQGGTPFILSEHVKK